MAVSVTTMSLDFDSSLGPNTEVFAKQEITIGRLPSNDIVLNHQHISGKHAKLVVTKGEDGNSGLYITDLGSKNGTFVGQIRLIPNALVKVNPHDRVRIGNYLMRPVYAPSQTDDALEKVERQEQAVSATQTVPSGRILQEIAANAGLYAVPAEEPVRQPLLEVCYDSAPACQAVAVAEEPEAVQEHNEQPPEDEKVSVAEVPQEDCDVSAPFFEQEVAEDIKTFNFVAIKLCTLAVSVVHKGRPLPGVTVYGGALGAAETDQAGVAKFENIREGTSYSLNAQRAGYLFRSSEMSGVIEGDDTFVLSATKLCSIKGSVVHRGSPLSGAEVDAGVLGKAYTDENGCYVFKDVPEDVEFDIRVVKEGFVVEPMKAAA